MTTSQKNLPWFRRRLQAGEILPDSRLGGDLYYTVERATKESIELRVYLSPTAETPDFVFPFAVEKK